MGHPKETFASQGAARGVDVLRDPAINERRVLFECAVDRIATFGKP